MVSLAIGPNDSGGTTEDIETARCAAKAVLSQHSIKNGPRSTMCGKIWTAAKSHGDITDPQHRATAKAVFDAVTALVESKRATGKCWPSCARRTIGCP
jgi:hypothetical protein